MRPLGVSYEVDAVAVGSYWWPIGVKWQRAVSQRFDADQATDLERLHDFGSQRPQRARAILDQLAQTQDGDSSSAVKFTGELIITRHYATHSVSRSIGLELLPSLRDYVVACHGCVSANPRYWDVSVFGRGSCGCSDCPRHGTDDYAWTDDSMEGND